MNITTRTKPMHFPFCTDCETRLYKHKDGKMRCNCEPDVDDPNAEELVARCAEARRLHAAGLLKRSRKRSGRGARAPVNEHKFQIARIEAKKGGL
jgi:hypothetical protein